eukprot:jgi/Mesvir1/21697/Mv04117-RA.1
MCGRTCCHLRAEDVANVAKVNVAAYQDMTLYEPSYNVSPGRFTPVMRLSEGGEPGAVVIQPMKWGLIPRWTRPEEKADHYQMFNARSEGVHERPAFRHLVKHNRCVAMCDGFYEWEKKGSARLPYFVYQVDETEKRMPMLMAGLFDTCERIAQGDGSSYSMPTYTVLTQSSQGTPLSDLHDRIPVLLQPDQVMEYLDPDMDITPLVAAKGQRYPNLRRYRVTAEMNVRSFDGPACCTKTSAEGSKIAALFASKSAKPSPSSAGHTTDNDNNNNNKKATTSSGGGSDKPSASCGDGNDRPTISDSANMPCGGGRVGSKRKAEGELEDEAGRLRAEQAVGVDSSNTGRLDEAACADVDANRDTEDGQTKGQDTEGRDNKDRHEEGRRTEGRQTNDRGMGDRQTHGKEEDGAWDLAMGHDVVIKKEGGEAGGQHERVSSSVKDPTVLSPTKSPHRSETLPTRRPAGGTARPLSPLKKGPHKPHGTKEGPGAGKHAGSKGAPAPSPGKQASLLSFFKRAPA